MLRNLLTYLIRLGIVAAVLWLAWGWLQTRRPKQLAWRWRKLGWQHKAMATALQERKRIEEVLRGSQLPVASSVMGDVDALVGSVADLVEVRLGLGIEKPAQPKVALPMTNWRYLWRAPMSRWPRPCGAWTRFARCCWTTPRIGCRMRWRTRVSALQSTPISWSGSPKPTEKCAKSWRGSGATAESFL